MTYPESVAWLYQTQLHGIKLGLDNIRRLTAALGVRVGGPEAPKFLHVAGTNGKGSVCAMLDAICRAANFKTGLFTSPHLVTFRERIRVNGEMIGEAAVAQGLSEIRRLAADWDHAPTFFEITTALALTHFQREGCEVVALETGLGGRLDATNIVSPAVCAITAIALDHQQWLGATIAQIAAEKAGIFKPEVPVISATQTEEVERILRRHGTEIGALVVAFAEEPWQDGPINLLGSHQLWNAALAVRALALSGLVIKREAILQGLREVQWEGRFQCVRPRVVLDGAHNPAAAAQLVQTWREVFGDERATLVLGILADKDVRGIGAELLPLAARVIAVPVQNPRTSQPDDLLAVLRELAPGLPCSGVGDLGAALTEAEVHGERVLVCGSLFLVGEALAHFDPHGRRPEVSWQ
jgi:dihydrofolate synthase/folylpolyglutamate synthase